MRRLRQPGAGRKGGAGRFGANLLRALSLEVLRGISA